MDQTSELPEPIRQVIAAVLAGDGIEAACNFLEDGTSTLALDRSLTVLLGWRRIIHSQGRLEIAKCLSSFLAYIEATEVTPLTITGCGSRWQTVLHCVGTFRGTVLVVTVRCAIDWDICELNNMARAATIGMRTQSLTLKNRRMSSHVAQSTSALH